MAFADPYELASWLGLPAFQGGSEAERRAKLLIQGATGVITTEADQDLEQTQSQEEILDGTGTDMLVLPRWPVTEMHSVELDGEALTVDEDYRLRGRKGLLKRVGDVWPCGGTVAVRFTAGYATIPDAIRQVCLGLAGRAWSNPVGTTSESIGDWSASYAVPGMSMTAAERRIVARYARAR